MKIIMTKKEFNAANEVVEFINKIFPSKLTKEISFEELFEAVSQSKNTELHYAGEYAIMYLKEAGVTVSFNVHKESGNWDDEGSKLVLVAEDVLIEYDEDLTITSFNYMSHAIEIVEPFIKAVREILSFNESIQKRLKGLLMDYKGDVQTIFQKLKDKEAK